MVSRDITDGLLTDAIRLLPSEQHGEGSVREYEAFYLTASMLYKHGIVISDESIGRPILLLAGTSLTIHDRIDLAKYLIGSGYEVASISNQIGGLFDVDIKPGKERVDSLRNYMNYLIESEKVGGVDILAQSYSAFEITRLLFENPAKYKQVVKSIVLINPPGFDENIGVIKHCVRFAWNHVLKGYFDAIKVKLNKNGNADDKKFAEREVAAITRWVCMTLKNPVRTIKEVFDIVSYKIKEPLVFLYKKHNYDINIFLQTDDQLLPVNITLSEINGVFPGRNIKLVPGGHNDLLFQKWQRSALFDFIKEIRLRESF